MKAYRVLSFILTLCMLLAFLPSVAFADGEQKAMQFLTNGTAPNIAGAQGSNVYFGTYFQSQIGGSEYYNPDPIKWRVLLNADGKLFLLSDKNLDAVKYREDYVSITWEYSTIRDWLNIDFRIGAFTNAEEAAIPEVTVVNDDNPYYDTEGGNDTNDKVFLLSIAEVMTEAYGFPTNYDKTEIRQATSTDYAKNRGVYTYRNGCGYWWLRSPGINDNNAAFVSDDGYVDYDGYNVDYAGVAVRPALNIDLNSVLFTSRAEGGKSSGGIGADALTAIPDYDGSDWKLTVKDSTRSDFTASFDSRDGDVWTVKYSGAKRGYHEYISAIIVNSSGVATHYGRLAAAESGDNKTVTVNLAGKINAGDKLYIFNEQANDDYMTDYASALIEIEETVTTYPLWIGETEVTSENFSGDGWSFEPDTNTLTLNNFTYEGEGHVFYYEDASILNELHSAITYLGDKKLNLVVNGTNTVTQTGSYENIESLFFHGPVEMSGNGALDVFAAAASGSNTQSVGVQCRNNLTLNGVKLSSHGGEAYISSGMFVNNTLTVTDSELYLEGVAAGYGSFGLYVGSLTADGGKLTVRGGDSKRYSFGINTNNTPVFRNCDVDISAGSCGSNGRSEGIGTYNNSLSITIESTVKSFVVTGKSSALYRNTNVTNGLAGIGWTDVEGTEGREDIPVHTSGTQLPAYKRIEFKTITHYDLWVGGVQVTSENMDDVLNDGTVKFEITDEGENVLTLTNANITGVYEEAITERTYNVYSRDTGFALTVKLIGENSMSGAEDAISLAGALQLTGDGTLTAEASNAGISVRYGITVDGPTVKASGIAYGVWTGGGTLSVKGTSKLTAEATGGMAIFAKTIDIDEGLSITTPTGARVGGYGEAETVYDSNIAIAAAVVIEKAYTVTVTPGENMTKTTSSGAVSQTVTPGEAMTAVVYTANEGYYFPTDYAVSPVNGVSVTRDGFTQITVAGNPTGDAAITLTATTAKNKEQTPTATFTATGTDTGTLSNVASGMKFKIDNGQWQTVGGNSVGLTNLAPCTITIYMPGNGTTTIDSDEQTITVTKAAVPTMAATQPTVINGTGSIPTTTEHQKSTNGADWTDCTGVWTGLNEGTYYVRVKAAGTVLASDAQEITINAFVPGKEQTPTAAFEATGADSGMLSNVAAGMKYKIDNGEWQTISGTSVDLTNLAPCTITVYKPGNGTTTIDSDEQTITVTKAAAPTVTATQPATINDKGMIPTTADHQKSTDGVTWEDCTGAWEDLDEGTYFVRVKAADTTFASDAQEIKIEVPKYTVKFLDEDGTELYSAAFKCGETPEYVGEIPTKDATAEFTYSFAGWTPEIIPVSNDAEYTVKFDSTLNKYEITFITNGGTELVTVTLDYGTPFTGLSSPTKEGFTFDGWYTDEGLSKPLDTSAPITGNISLYAKWTAVPKLVSDDNNTSPKTGYTDRTALFVTFIALSALCGGAAFAFCKKKRFLGK